MSTSFIWSKHSYFLLTKAPFYKINTVEITARIYTQYMCVWDRFVFVFLHFPHDRTKNIYPVTNFRCIVHPSHVPHILSRWKFLYHKSDFTCDAMD